MSDVTYAQLFAEYTDMIVDFEDMAERHEENIDTLMGYVRNNVYFFGDIKLTDLVSESRKGADNCRKEIKKLIKQREELIDQMNGKET